MIKAAKVKKPSNNLFSKNIGINLALELSTCYKKVMLYVLHFATTWFLIGLSWFVEGVHYPLFQEVPKEVFRNYSRLHQIKTSMVVSVPMAFEVVSAFSLLFFFPFSYPFFFSALLLAPVWLSTYLAVRSHKALEKRKTEKELDKLMHAHLLRTLSWSARGFILIFFPISSF